MHRRRKRGGQWGHLPTQAAGSGGSAPTTTAMLIYAVLGLAIIYYIEFKNK